jgi:hypothetical protein
MNLEEKDLRITLSRLMDIFDIIHQKYSHAKENENSYDEADLRLTRKEENGKNIFNIEIEQLYLNQQNMSDSNQNSEYGPDDDLDPDLNVIKILSLE